MDTTTITIIGVVLVLIVAFFLMAPNFTNRNRTKKLQEKFGNEYDLAKEKSGDEKKAQAELLERQKHVETLDIRPLTEIERERYVKSWGEVQSRFVDEPNQAIVEGDRLIMEVMQLRGYPVSDFDQRAADISVNYPELVSNYRAARTIALKNEQKLADTEELRQAMIYYRSLFEELLEVKPVVA